jgi:signal transduction histidine kinase
MSGLSGAEFVAYSRDGRVSETSFARLRDRPPTLDAIPRVARVDRLGQAPTVDLDGVRYLAVSLVPSEGSQASALMVLYPLTVWQETRREAVTPPLLLGLGALLAMVAVTGWIAQRISRRIRFVRRQVASIAGGDFETIDAGRHRDEIGDLAESINSMCLQLRKMSRTIRHAERTKVLAQLAAGLAHQLRNALTGARMSVQLHARRCQTANADQSLVVALRQLTMIEEQVKGLLSLGHVETRNPVACNVQRLLADVALMVYPGCEHAKIDLRVEENETAQEAWADEEGLRAVVLNLVLNAIDAAGHGGSVRLKANARGGSVAIEVLDSGPGPPPEIAESLFDPFTTSKPEGIGIGLAFARQIAEQNGGSLDWNRSNNETCFCLLVPRPDDPALRKESS